MASVSGEVDIRATTAQILDVIADLPHYPEWSSVHKRASVERFGSDGRPGRVVMAVTAGGLTDEQVLDYEWAEDGVTWALVKSAQQRAQQGSYSISQRADGVSHVRYDLDITPAVPVPGIIVRQVMRKAVSAATEGLRKRVESLHQTNAG